jgi:hypothetical protein
MPFSETGAVYCENRTGRTYQGFSSYLAECTSHTTTEPIRLMLFALTVSVYVRTTRNTEVHSVVRMRRAFDTVKQVVHVRFEVFTAVTMKNCVFWDVTPCGSCKNRRFGGT